MLRSSYELQGYTIRAQDGEIGSVEEFLFDDQRWVIRYLVVNTGGWLTGRLVLVSPIAIATFDGDAQAVDVSLTRKQVEDSPDISTDQPVSRQKEAELAQYYGYPPYWNGPGFWGMGMYPGRMGYMAGVSPIFDEMVRQESGRVEQERGDPHLRSTRAVSGYDIRARDGDIGHVEDFLIDDETWAIRYVVVDTKNWWPGKHVLVAPQWIDQISWEASAVTVNLTRDEIKSGPEYDPSLLDREYETRLHQHYRRQGYWESEDGEGKG